MKKKETNTLKGIKITCLLFVVTLLAQAKVHSIVTVGTTFNPSSLDITVGDTVIWTNTTGFHNVNGTMADHPANPESFSNTASNNWTLTHVFTLPGYYEYNCDPHKDLGMEGSVTVMEAPGLSIDFMGMTPHVGQNLFLTVIDTETGHEIKRVKQVITESFNLEIEGVENGKSYRMDFFADFNENGRYDSPPTDHAWRLELNGLMGDTILEFTHNTNFTDIGWQNKFTMNFEGMMPHIGQKLELFIYDTDAKNYVDTLTLNSIESAEFNIITYILESEHSYELDFYADLNGDGAYSTPPGDHAWRISLENIEADTSITFIHHVDFTDILRKYTLTLNFSGMTPHVGQLLQVFLKDKEAVNYQDTITLDAIASADFEILFNGILAGHSYYLDFYADLSENEMYDNPPTDHAWRINISELKGDTVLAFAHNVNFTDIFPKTNPVGITKAAQNKVVQIYPNPASEKLYISNLPEGSGHMCIEISDLTGKLVYVNNEIPVNEMRGINISQLRNGTYILRIQQNETLFSSIINVSK